MANINLYKDNPTAGATDGTAISLDGTYTSPLAVSLDAVTSESKIVKLAVRTDAGHTTSGNTTISDKGDTSDHWKFSLTENGTFTDSITISTPINNANIIFYAKVSSVNTEQSMTDRSVAIRVTAAVVAAS